MLIKCPKCSTKYKLDISQNELSDKPLRLKCGSCKATFAITRKKEKDSKQSEIKNEFIEFSDISSNPSEFTFLQLTKGDEGEHKELNQKIEDTESKPKNKFLDNIKEEDKKTEDKKTEDKKTEDKKTEDKEAEESEADTEERLARITKKVVIDIANVYPEVENWSESLKNILDKTNSLIDEITKYESKDYVEAFIIKRYKNELKKIDDSLLDVEIQYKKIEKQASSKDKNLGQLKSLAQQIRDKIHDGEITLRGYSEKKPPMIFKQQRFSQDDPINLYQNHTEEDLLTAAIQRKSATSGKIAGIFILIMIALIIFILWRNNWQVANPVSMVSKAFSSSKANGTEDLSQLDAALSIPWQPIKRSDGKTYILATGTVFNKSLLPWNQIKVKAVITTKYGEKLHEQIFPVGKRFTDSQLSSYSPQEIERSFNEYNSDIQNLILQPQKSIDFSIVFTYIPDSCQQNPCKILVEVTFAKLYNR